jgi:hypothetical protein
MRANAKKVAGSYLMKRLPREYICGWIDADVGRWKFAGKISKLLEARKWHSDAKNAFSASIGVALAI